MSYNTDLQVNNSELEEILLRIQGFPSGDSRGVNPLLQNKSVKITQNGVTDILPDNGYNGLSKVTVNVSIPIKRYYAQSTQPSGMSNGDLWLKI